MQSNNKLGGKLPCSVQSEYKPGGKLLCSVQSDYKPGGKLLCSEQSDYKPSGKLLCSEQSGYKIINIDISTCIKNAKPCTVSCKLIGSEINYLLI